MATDWGSVIGQGISAGIGVLGQVLSNKAAKKQRKHELKLARLGADPYATMGYQDPYLGGYAPAPSYAPVLYPQTPTVPVGGQILSSMFAARQPEAQPMATYRPGGSVVPASWTQLLPALGGAAAPLLETYLSTPRSAPSFGGVVGGGSSTVPSRLSMARELTVTNPVTGRLVTYVNRGTPLLYSGDLAACRRVQKIARKAARYAGSRRAYGPRRRRSH